jgi:hypothetical protein
MLMLLIGLSALPAVWAPGARAQDDGTGGDPIAAVSHETAETGPILPEYRILSYYGFPGNEFMGILGEHTKPELRKRLVRQARAYEAADPTRPVKLAFEVIASVAQRDPMADGSYLLRTDPRLIEEYVNYTAKHGMLLILDVQFGRETIQEEIEAVRPWLELPHVHLALDGEFSIEEGETPGVELGSIDAAEIRYAQETLAELAATAGIPPKLLIVHQFNVFMITNKEAITDVPGVQTILEVDGWGAPELKRETYAVLTGDRQFTHYGFKLWYRQDEPLLTPAEVVGLEPSPDLVIYQ